MNWDGETQVCPHCYEMRGHHASTCPRAPRTRGTINAAAAMLNCGVRQRQAALIRDAEVRWLGGGRILEVEIKGERLHFDLTPRQEQAMRRATA